MREYVYFVRPDYGIYQIELTHPNSRLTIEDHGADDGIYIKGRVIGAIYLSDSRNGYETITLHEFTKTYSILEEALDAYPSVCPESGEFIAYKQVTVLRPDIPLYTTAVAKLRIPVDAKRVSSVGRKCRADKAEVMEIKDYKGYTYPIAENAFYHYVNAVYKVGEMVYADSFDPDRTTQCSHGIHFFMTENEAWEY